MAKRIVIIEDDLNIMELLVYLFENDGYHVTSFTKSQTAADISLLSPTVVLLDVNLAGSPQRGDEICTAIKGLASTRKLTVLLLSAEKDLESIAINCGADDYLSKPFDIDKLLTKVKNLQ